jgi:hypothetical protein
MNSKAVAVGTSLVLAVAADDIYRTIYIHHQSQNAIYIGGDNLTTANGLHIEKDQTMTIELPAKQTIYAISSHASQELRVLTPDLD